MGGSEDDEEETVKGERERDRAGRTEREGAKTYFLKEEHREMKTYHQKQTKKQQYFLF